jgi:hypothetical protein
MKEYSIDRYQIFFYKLFEKLIKTKIKKLIKNYLKLSKLY